MPSGGAGPTYVSVHPSGKFLLVANYFGGSVAVLPILADGRLGPATDVKQDAGTVGPRRSANAPPGSFAFSGHDRTHAHMIQADPSGRFVLHVDLGLDRIFVWKFDDRAGVLTPNDFPEVALPPGDGPRHFAFHPNGHWLYSVQEEGSNIVLFDYDGAKGRLTSRQTISSLPPGFAGSNFCSEILVSADGRFVYAGNRLHDSIGDLLGGPHGRTDLRRRGLDARQLSPELQLRSHRPVPLLLQPAGRQRGGVPRGSPRPAAWTSPATTRRWATRRASCSSTWPRPDSAAHVTCTPEAGRGGHMSEKRFFHVGPDGRLRRLPALDDILGALRDGGYAWLDFFDPSKDDLMALVEPFGLHPLSVEDCLDEDQVPKIEDFPTNTFLLLNGYHYRGRRADAGGGGFHPREELPGHRDRAPGRQPQVLREAGAGRGAGPGRASSRGRTISCT